MNGMSGVLGGVSSDLCSLAVLDVVTLLYQDRFNRPLHGESTEVAQHVLPRRVHRHVRDLETEPFKTASTVSLNRVLLSHATLKHSCFLHSLLARIRRLVQALLLALGPLSVCLRTHHFLFDIPRESGLFRGSQHPVR